jgi:alkanesulfonate monooxygenase SsuD/methylene tetrahydromethanopterin reductase-like flavin-dependent oxidoreductase (luciferase family)
VSQVRLGVTLPQFTDDPERLVDAARRAEECGLDSVWLFDHLWPLTGGKSRAIFECWSSLAYVVATTQRVAVGSLVTRSSMRHPAVLAKIAATSNAIAPGRVVVGIGSGDAASRGENEAIGLPYFGGRSRIDQLASSVTIVRSFFESDEVHHSDDFVRIRGLPPSPRPSPRPRVWVAGRGRATLEVAATLGDAWNGWGGRPEDFRRDAQIVRELAGARRVHLTWAGLVLLADSRAEAAAKLGNRPASNYLIGDFDTVCNRIAQYVGAGAEHVIVTFPDSWAPENFEALAAMRPLLPPVPDSAPGATRPKAF